MTSKTETKALLEFRAELLKERIYATFILLAVLLTIDPKHTTPLQAIGIIAGTALSLWLASMVASQMAHRIVTQRIEHDGKKVRLRLAKHRPLIYAALFPLFMHSLAFVGLVSVEVASSISIVSMLLLLVVWSLLSASALKAGRFPTIVLASLELLIGLAIVGLKLASNH